jgi:hypothetical protein
MLPILSRAALFVVVVTGALSVAGPVHAQARFDSHPSREQMLLGNIIIGSITAGAGALIGGHRILPAVAKGAAGGAVAYGGKEIIAREGSLAAWTGRQVGALGASAVANAARGRSVVSELVLPVGPVRLYVVPRSKTVQPRVDVAGVLAFALVSIKTNTTLDLSASVRSGAMVFSQNKRYGDAPGVHRAGVLRIDELPLIATRNGSQFAEVGVRTHELIHASQYDFASIAWGGPLERAVLGRSKTGKALGRYVDFGFILPLWSIANGIAAPRSRPWEREANSLAPGG